VAGRRHSARDERLNTRYLDLDAKGLKRRSEEQGAKSSKIRRMSPDTRPAIGRNDPCHCGSGRKYKVCCLAKDEADARAARAQSAAAAPADATAAPARAETPVHTRPPKATQQPWKRSAMNTHGFQRRSSPRKVGGS